MRRVIVVCLVVTASVLSGCYRYVRVSPDASPVGKEVRVRVNQAEERRLEDDLGRLEGPSLQGKFLQALTDDDFLLSYHIPGVEGAARRFDPTVVVRRDGIEGLEVRRLSWVHTGLVTGGMAAAVVAILESGLLTSTQDEGPPDPEALSLTLLRLRF